MKLTEQYAEVWGECPSTWEESKLRLERAGRICWKSEDKIEEGSADGFIDRMVKKKHAAVWETSNLVLRSPTSTFPRQLLKDIESEFHSKFLTCTPEGDRVYIGGNYRAWMELWDLKDPRELWNKIATLVYRGFEEVQQADIPWALKRISVLLYTDRAVTHEIVRHRPASFLQESQRYVRYDGGMAFIQPYWWDSVTDEVRQLFLDSCKQAELTYQALRQDLPPEGARVVLPNACATEIVVTADLVEWSLIFKLRTPAGVYPPTRSLVQYIEQEFGKKGWIS